MHDIIYHNTHGKPLKQVPGRTYMHASLIKFHAYMIYIYKSRYAYEKYIQRADIYIQKSITNTYMISVIMCPHQNKTNDACIHVTRLMHTCHVTESLNFTIR